MQPKLGIIAGGGALPLQLAHQCRAAKRDYFILGIEGACTMQADATVALGSIGAALAHLKQAGAVEVVMAGHLKRPPMRQLKLDATGTRLMAKLGLKLLGGDDALLKEIVRFLESEGFRVVGADAILGGLLVEARCYTRLSPDAQALEAITLGMRAAKALGALDIGQAVVVEGACVLAVEGAEGTDGLLARSAALLREAKRAVLVKAKKPGQEDRADLPAIGEDTVRRAADAGFLGIALEAGGALLLQREGACALADAAGMFIAGVHA